MQALTMRELRKYNVETVCLSEVRVLDSGHSVIKVPGEEACYHLYHSGVMDNTGRHGMAIALSEAAQAALLTWVPISSRLASVRLKETMVHITVVAVYASTLDAVEEATSSMITFKIPSTGFPQETCWLSQGTGTQDSVQWTWQHGISCAILLKV